jgi:hypothetical protein
VQLTALHEERIEIILRESARKADWGMAILLFAFEAKEAGEKACHALVSELSFLCCSPDK